MTKLFKSPEDKTKVLKWHDRFLEQIKTPTKNQMLSTTFGDTHVRIGGPEDAPPLILLHGALAGSAHVLVEAAPLLENFRVYAVDVIGQSAKSAEADLSVSNNDYGDWLAEVMDGLSLQRAHVMGVSWGGFVAIRLAAVAPERIDRLALVVPAGVVKTPFLNNIKVGIPMTMFMLAPNPRRQQNFLNTQLTTTDDELWVPYLATAFHAYNLKMSVPALAKPHELSSLQAPVFIAAAEKDLSFPGEKLLTRAADLFPNLQQTLLIEDSSHCPPTTPEFRLWLNAQITNFLTNP